VKAGTGLIVIQEREQWLALVRTAMNLQVPSDVENILATISSQEGLCSTELVVNNKFLMLW
jgi:hypothetical protein